MMRSLCQRLRIVATRLALTAFLAALHAPAIAAGTANGAPQRILFVGNSLTYWTDVPARLQKAAKAIGRAVTVESRKAAAFG